MARKTFELKGVMMEEVTAYYQADDGTVQCFKMAAIDYKEATGPKRPERNRWSLEKPRNSEPVNMFNDPEIMKACMRQEKEWQETALMSIRPQHGTMIASPVLAFRAGRAIRTNPDPLLGGRRVEVEE